MSEQLIVPEENLGDWRKQLVTYHLKDVPELKISAGTPVEQTIYTKDPEGRALSFVMPSSAALGLNVAYNASKAATSLYKEIELKVGSQLENGKEVFYVMNTSRLFDYFEQFMIAITFSFQSIEVFCNEVIVTLLKDKKMKLSVGKKQKEIQEFNAKQIQKKMPTERKVVEILPKLIHIAQPSGEILQQFTHLNQIRNRIIHLNHDEVTNIGEMEKETLFYQLLKHGEVLSYPLIASNTIAYFATDYILQIAPNMDRKRAEPRWVKLVIQKNFLRNKNE